MRRFTPLKAAWILCLFALLLFSCPTSAHAAENPEDYRAVQSRIPQNGYVLAPAIGGYEYGGGICQVSSTLYAAMCHAMLPATERHPHSSRVSYLPVGLDATISKGRKDLQFVNPYSDPLTILAETEGGVLTVSLVFETPEAADSEQTEDSTAVTDAAAATTGPASDPVLSQ